MDSLEFIAIVAFFAVVMLWYLKNAEAGSDGLLGILAIIDDPESAGSRPSRAYRMKERKTRSKDTDIRTASAENPASATYAIADDSARMRQRFRRQDEARYKVKDKVKEGVAASYKPRRDDLYQH